LLVVKALVLAAQDPKPGLEELSFPKGFIFGSSDFRALLGGN
jgi:hypothetical protein